MVTVAEALQVLYPNAITFPTQGYQYLVTNNGSGDQISYWNAAALGTQPTPTQLAAVTDAQVTAAQNAVVVGAAATALQTAIDPVSVANRAQAVTAWTNGRNDVAEFCWAALQCVCTALNVSVPTAAQIETQIVANRTANPIDPLATDPATVSTTGNVRLNQTQILNLIGTVLSSGGGLPSS